MRHILKLQPRYYNSMKNGIKLIELRLLDEKRKNKRKIWHLKVEKIETIYSWKRIWKYKTR